MPLLRRHAAAAALASLLNVAAAGEPFVVHEWGVHITGAAHLVGTPAQRDPRPVVPQPVLGPPRELIDGLPTFVGRHDLEYRPRMEFREWDKPVLHFYGDVAGEITVEIRTPQGRPLAYWPLPQLIEQTDWGRMSSGVTDAVAMRWTGRLSAAVPAGALPQVGAGHWWQRCREVPGRYLTTATGTERFLFYEGTSRRSPSVRAHLGRPDAINVFEGHNKPLAGPVVVIVNDAGSLRLGAPAIPAQASRFSIETEPVADDGEAILAACRAQWEAFGMSAVEARMIVEVWREDLLGRPGFLVIARMAPDEYEAMFPLTITPKPDQLVRVGLVFDTLPEIPVADRLTWLPRLSAAMRGWGADLAGADGPSRSAAIAGLAKAGDLARPLLDTLRTGSDMRVRAAALELLARLRPDTLFETGF